jgi:hypothetical protein
LCFTFGSNGGANDTAHGFVKFKHVQEVTAYLGHEKSSNRDTSRDVGFQYIIENFNILGAGENIHVARGL